METKTQSTFEKWWQENHEAIELEAKDKLACMLGWAAALDHFCSGMTKIFEERTNQFRTNAQVNRPQKAANGGKDEQ